MTVEIFTEKNRWNGKIEWGAYVSDWNGFVKDGNEDPVRENVRWTEEMFHRKAYMTVCNPDYPTLKAGIEARFKIELPKTVSASYGKSVKLNFGNVVVDGTDRISAGCTVWVVVNASCEDGRYAVEGVYQSEEKANQRIAAIQASGEADSYVYRPFKVW